MNSSFTSFLFTRPTSHFLFFSLLLIFYLILSATKNGLILFQHLSYFSHHKHSRSFFCQPICDYLLTHFVRWPSECHYVDAMFMCSYISLDVLLFVWIGTVVDWFTLRDEVPIFNKSTVILSEILLLNLPRQRGEYLGSTSNRSRPFLLLLSAVHRKKH
jgi:hypothetical protein